MHFQLNTLLMERLETLATIVHFILLIFYATSAHSKQSRLELANTAFISCYLLPQIGFQWSSFYLVVAIWDVSKKDEML
jgi:hypothetical protein